MYTTAKKGVKILGSLMQQVRIEENSSPWFAAI